PGVVPLPPLPTPADCAHHRTAVAAPHAVVDRGSLGAARSARHTTGSATQTPRLLERRNVLGPRRRPPGAARCPQQLVAAARPSAGGSPRAPGMPAAGRESLAAPPHAHYRCSTR